MCQTDVVEEDGLSLFDFWEKLRKGWRYVVCGIVVGVLGAATVILVTPNQYEAVAIVLVGQVGQVGQVAQVGQVGQVSSFPAEPPTQTAERMKSAAFQSAVAQALGDQRWINLLQNGGVSGVLNVATPKGALSIIELRSKGDSPHAAKRVANGAIEELAKRHAEIAKPALDRLKLEAGIARERLRRAESELESLGKLVNGAAVKDERFTQLSLVTNLRVQKEAEIFYQRQMLSALDGALTPPNTQPAKAIEDVFVTDRPTSPKKKFLLAAGFVGGLLVGVMWVFISAAWCQARDRSLSRELPR